MRELTGTSTCTSKLFSSTRAFILYAATTAASTTGLATLLALAGCASEPIPTEQFALSQSAIESATAAGATEYAALDIKNARDKLAAAQRAVEEKEYVAAAALAEEATVDAKLAETKAESEKAKKSLAELQDNLRTLLDEVNRGQQQLQMQQQQQQPSSPRS